LGILFPLALVLDVLLKGQGCCVNIVVALNEKEYVRRAVDAHYKGEGYSSRYPKP
jgi:hypothetical protein